MALTIGDNFSYMGAKPLDARLKYDTITAMASMSASTLYDGIIAYCLEDGKTYQWKSGNTTDPTLGKWREFETGGALVLGETSSTAYRGDRGKAAYDFSQNPATATPEMDGVGAAGSSGKWAREDHVHPSDTTKADNDIIAPAFDETETYAIGDRVTYNGGLYRFTSAHTGAWVAGDATEVTVDGEIPQELTAAQMQAIKDAFTPNGGAPLRMLNYSTDEQVVGTWIDSKPLYQKTVVITNIPNNNMTQTAHGISNIGEVCRVDGVIHAKTSVVSYSWNSLPRVQDNSTTQNLSFDVLQTTVQLKARQFDASASFDKAYITIQYTKTTD